MNADSTNRREHHAAVIAQLTELVTALERRIPQVARAGERKIAEGAQTLRHAALLRLHELARAAEERRAAHFARIMKPRNSDDNLLSCEPAYAD